MMRRASGRMIGSEFSLAYTLAKGVKHLALIGHNDCGMTKVAEHKDSMIDALIEQGCHRDRAEDYVIMHAALYAITDEIDSLRSEYMRLRRLFRKLEIAPLFLSLANSKLYIPGWYFQMLVAGKVDVPLGAESSVPDEDLLTLS
jgi:carbonic anhydrase